MVEYPDYQIPVTQIKGPKGNGDKQAAKRDNNATNGIEQFGVAQKVDQSVSLIYEMFFAILM